MDQEFPVHSEAVRARLDRIAADQQEILRAGMAVIEAGAAKMFPMDFFAFGAVKRYLSTACAFGLMIETWNLVCARSLLRIHLDTALRFSAAWQVDNPHEFALAVLNGAQIDRIADRNKKLMKDAYLVALHTPDHPWLPEVYKRLSGYVHFSSSHMIDSVQRLGEEENWAVHFNLSETDTNKPEFSWLEVADCFIESTDLLRRYLLGYAATKDAPLPDRAADQAAD